MEGDRVFDFDIWRNLMSYWKGDLQYKETIKSFLSNKQWKKLRDGIFGNFFRLQSVKFCDIKGLHEKENRLSKVYFLGKDRVELGDLFNFITSHTNGITASCVGSNDDAVKLATIYFVESVLMEKRKNRNVSEQIMKIVDDDELCSSFNWGSLCYETLLKSLKSCLKPNENENEKEKEKEKDKDKDKDNYTILGFAFTFCVWIMEVYKLIEVVPFIPIEEDIEHVSVHEPISQDQSSMPSSIQFDEAMFKEIKLSEKFKKDLHAEVTRINQKIVVSEKRFKMISRNIERESSVPITKDGVDDHCDGTEPTITINKDAESVDGVEVQDVVECQDQKNPKETGVTKKICKCGVQSQDFESPLGTSVSEIVCKCLEGTYDMSTPLSYKEKFRVQNYANQESFKAAREEDGVEYQDKSGVQSQDLENTQGTSISKIVSECIDGTCDLSTPHSLTDNIGSQENANEDNYLTAMILTVANESCELAIEEHGEQLQDKENVQLEDKENATNILAQLSVEKIQEGNHIYIVLSADKDEDLNQYTRKRKRDSIGYDGPSFSILTPTPTSTQMSIDEGLSMEVDGNIEEELGQDDAKLLNKFIVWLGKEKMKGRKKAGQTDIYADDNGVRKNSYKLYHQKISRKMFFLELSDSSFVLDDKHIDIALYYPRKKECYHSRDHPFCCTTTDILFDNYMMLVHRCGIAWTEVDKIFFPCRLPLEDDNAVTHFLLGVLDLNKKKIDVYDSIYSEPYEVGMNYIEMYACMIPHWLKFSQFEKHHKSFGNAFNKFDIQWQRSPHQTGSTDCGTFLIKYVELLMMGKDVKKFQPEDINDFRKELAANLYAHGEWKRNSGYDTLPEDVGDDYDSENETCCPKEL
ncbi:uncharacterized protein [Nicotiana sylvestris]|uniref:uncharacterized protein n=1 Tax=Nicotiana sylvestris TaxID=4096 RepID=UPI00388CD65B